MTNESPKKLGNLQANSRTPNLSPGGAPNVDNTSYLYAWEVDKDMLEITAVNVVLGTPTKSPCGQNIIFSAAATAVGRDYLGQIMTETLAAPGAGAKAFAVVDSLTAGTATWGVEYGLPYAGASDADADGAITAADTAVATALTGDVRGTVNFTANPDGLTDKSFTYTCKSSDLHGVVQF
ncbi:MAG: hypothetical protein BMS9Abin11_1789 [Gammaproteobacteria bacterium]|nr:MAG: hypothetical protein BMS9Abin11_1789 [Gammaproteobacteria bacterium]